MTLLETKGPSPQTWVSWALTLYLLTSGLPDDMSSRLHSTHQKSYDGKRDAKSQLGRAPHLPVALLSPMVGIKKVMILPRRAFAISCMTLHSKYPLVSCPGPCLSALSSSSAVALMHLGGLTPLCRCGDPEACYQEAPDSSKRFCLLLVSFVEASLTFPGSKKGDNVKIALRTLPGMLILMILLLLLIHSAIL